MTAIRLMGTDEPWHMHFFPARGHEAAMFILMKMKHGLTQRMKLEVP